MRGQPATLLCGLYEEAPDASSPLPRSKPWTITTLRRAQRYEYEATVFGLSDGRLAGSARVLNDHRREPVDNLLAHRFPHATLDSSSTLLLSTTLPCRAAGESRATKRDSASGHLDCLPDLLQEPLRTIVRVLNCHFIGHRGALPFWCRSLSQNFLRLARRLLPRQTLRRGLMEASPGPEHLHDRDIADGAARRSVGSYQITQPEGAASTRAKSKQHVGEERRRSCQHRSGGRSCTTPSASNAQLHVA